MPAKAVAIIIDRQERLIVPGLVEGRDLITLAALSGTDQLLLEISGDIDVPVSAQDAILIRGGEKFSIGDGTPHVDDNPCLRHPIHFHFNDHPVPKDRLFSKAKVTGAQLKQLDPNLQPGDALIADLDGLADETIRDDQRIILQHADRFITVPCGNVGYEDVLDQQIKALQAAFPTARVEQTGNTRYVVVPEFPVPEGYVPSQVTMLFIIPNGFPMAAPDMFWVAPEIRLADGREPEGASTYEQHLGRTWQRFSWHYTHGQAAWRIGHSSLITHVQFCQARFGHRK